MKKYKKRIVDEILMKKLKGKGAVLIEGARWCGKTTTAEQVSKSILYMAKPEDKNQNIMLADINPILLLNGDVPRLIDEWQLAPKLWDAIIHLRNDSYGLIEVKLGDDKLIEEECTNLTKLKNKIDTNFMNSPAFMMVLTGVGSYAYKREDGIFVVPIGCLKN